MKNDIRDKLQGELMKKIEGEPQVVYILSRVRKILEIDGREDEYKILKFYCDWALHPKINNIRAVKDLIDGVVASDARSNGDLTMWFGSLHKDLKRFFKENGLSTILYDSDEKTFWFNKFLSQIYSDTPLVVDGKLEVSWVGRAGETSFGGSFAVKTIPEVSKK
jgi:hypothetical protein